MSLDILPFQEFLVQKTDKTLWYYEGMYSALTIILASDRLAPTIAHVEFNPKSFSLIVTTPLDVYQATIEEQCRAATKQIQLDAWRANASGRCDEDYTLEAMLFYLFAPGGAPVKMIQAASVLLDVAYTSEPTTIGKVIEDAVAGWFYSRALKKALNLTKEWLVEICSETTMKVIAALPSRTDFYAAPCFKRLDQIYAFRSQVDMAKFAETCDFLKKKPERDMLFINK